MSSITLGVMGLVATDSLAANATSGVHDQARRIAGGDAVISVRDSIPPAMARVLDSLEADGTRVATQTSFVSMANRASGSDTPRLVQVRAVTPGYPFFGGVRTAPLDAWARLHDGANAVVDDAVLTALGIRLGDSIMLGTARFAVIGTIRDVASDVAITTTLGPRAYIPQRMVAATHLLGVGSRARRDLVVRLRPGLDEAMFATRFSTQMARQGMRVRTAEQNAERIGESIGYLRNFLALIGLIALMLGGIGVASGIRAFVLLKIDTAAILRCLGATASQVLLLYVTQAAALGLVGAAIGALLGVMLQFLLGALVSKYLPEGMHVALAPLPIAAGILTGLWVAVVCALRPLLALRRVSPLQALRREEDSVALGGEADWTARAVSLAMVLSLLLVTISRAQRWQEGVAFAAGILGVIGALWLSATVLARAARAWKSAAWPFPLRHGIASLHRPGNQTKAVVVSLGFGVFLVGTLYQAQSSLLAATSDRLAQLHANVVFFDVQSDQASALDSLLIRSRTTVLTRIPILTVRVGAINGRALAALMADSILRPAPATQNASRGRRRDEGSSRRAIGREWRATYSDTLGTSESIVVGQWFGRSTTAVGEVSLEATAAARLGVSVGDEIVWQLQGVPITTRVTSLRAVDRLQLQPSFQVVFPSALVRGAPMQYVLLANADSARVAGIQRDVVAQFPNVSTVDLTLVEATIATVLTKIGSAIRGLTLVCVILAVPVLFSAVAATRRQRLREAVLLKVIGATKKQVGRMLLTEYLVVGVLGSIAGSILSIAAAWTMCRFLFKVPFVGAPLPGMEIALLMIAVVVSIGLLTGREVFSTTPMNALRE